MPSLRKILADEQNTFRALVSIFRSARAQAMPWLPVLHTTEEDFAYFTGHGMAHQELWGAFEGEALVGFISFDKDWVQHLYVEPEQQRKRIGSQLLDKALDNSGPKKLYTFEENHGARQFYENHGFAAIAFGDGSGNEEKMPDVLYVWGRAEG